MIEIKVHSACDKAESHSPNLVLSLASLPLHFSLPFPYLYIYFGAQGHEQPLIRETKANQSAGAGWIESFTAHSNEAGRVIAVPSVSATEH